MSKTLLISCSNDQTIKVYNTICLLSIFFNRNYVLIYADICVITMPQEVQICLQWYVPRGMCFFKVMES